MDADLGRWGSRWQIVEDGFDPARQTGTRHSSPSATVISEPEARLEESYEGALPGTFLRGVFDHHDSAVIDLVKAPDWVAFAVVVTASGWMSRPRRSSATDGSWICARASCHAETVFEDSAGRRTRIETIRFASRADQHLCGLQARITPENHSAAIRVHSGVDGTYHNLDRRPFYPEPPRPTRR